jgi:hypothetical protein
MRKFWLTAPPVMAAAVLLGLMPATPGQASSAGPGVGAQYDAPHVAHFTPAVFKPLATIPDNRFYLDPAAADAFIRAWLAFSHGHIAVDDDSANGAEIGLPGSTYRKVLIDSAFGETLVIVTGGHLPYPFGRDAMGYAVPDLTATLAKAKTAGAHVLWGPYTEPGLGTAIVEFPGGYICELHQGTP